jgi:hypothetical protein
VVNFKWSLDLFQSISTLKSDKFSTIKIGFGFHIPKGLNLLTFLKNPNQSSFKSTIFVISISFTCLEKSNLFTSPKILDLNSDNFSFAIENHAACLCPQKARNISFLFSKISIIEKYSGALQLATYLSHSSLNAIHGL